MGVLGRRTRGEPPSELSERTSQPPPSTTSGHCLRVRPGSPITYVHDKVGALKHPTVPAPPAAWSPPRTASTQTPPALAIRLIAFASKQHRSKPRKAGRGRVLTKVWPKRLRHPHLWERKLSFSEPCKRSALAATQFCVNALLVVCSQSGGRPLYWDFSSLAYGIEEVAPTWVTEMPAAWVASSTAFSKGRPSASALAR